MDWKVGIIVVLSILGAKVFFGERQTLPAHPVQRKRLPRDNAHQWADLIEDKLGSLTVRIRVLYVLLGIAILGLIVASLY